MKGSSSVCLLCRLQAAKATGSVHAVQWQTQVARISTSPKLNATGHGTIHQPSPYARRILAGRHGSRSNTQTPRADVAGEQPPSQVDAFFQQVLQEQEALRHAGSRMSAYRGASVDLSLVKAIEKLEDMVRRKTSAADAFLYYRTEVEPATQTSGTRVPQAYLRVKLELLDMLVEAKIANMFDDKLPAVADIFRSFAEVGELKPRQWARVVHQLVKSIIGLNSQKPPLREAMISDLIESWKILSLERPAISRAGEDELTSGFWFPRLDKFHLDKFARTGNFTPAFCTLFPQYPMNHLGSHISVLAIATCALMHDPKRCTAMARQNASRFISKVANLVMIVDYKDSSLREELVSTFPDLEPYVMDIWPKIRPQLKKYRAFEVEKPRKSPTTSVLTHKKEVTQVFDAASISHNLSRLNGPKNIGPLETLWKEFIGPDEIPSKERAAQIRQYPELIDSFINARMALRQPEKAMMAWGLLGKVGLQPSLRTWNSMLDGLRKAGNLNGIKNIWSKLAKSGLKLDTGIWTTRIAGLVGCGDVEGCLQALEEMARNKSSPAVVLAVGPVNAALSGLIHLKHYDTAEQLLAWAEKKGISPDIITYNTLLRWFIRDTKRSKDIKKIFATMEAQGVAADEATFVIVLDASFSKDDIRSAEEQTSIVAEMASSMSKAGLQLNMHAYGKMIYLLLRSGAKSAAMAVVNHLYNRNMELSPHIYTMLIENCFLQDPPALDSVQLLVQRRRIVDFDDMDSQFYDRVVRGYALLDEAQLALDTYKHVDNAGAGLSLWVMYDLVAVLLRQNRLDDARDVVNREKRRFEREQPDATDHADYWGHEFWGLASRWDLLDSPLPLVRGTTTS